MVCQLHGQSPHGLHGGPLPGPGRALANSATPPAWPPPPGLLTWRCGGRGSSGSPSSCGLCPASDTVARHRATPRRRTAVWSTNLVLWRVAGLASQWRLRVARSQDGSRRAISGAGQPSAGGGGHHTLRGRPQGYAALRQHQGRGGYTRRLSFRAVTPGLRFDAASGVRHPPARSSWPSGTIPTPRRFWTTTARRAGPGLPLGPGTGTPQGSFITSAAWSRPPGASLTPWRTRILPRRVYVFILTLEVLLRKWVRRPTTSARTDVSRTAHYGPRLLHPCVQRPCGACAPYLPGGATTTRP